MPENRRPWHLGYGFFICWHSFSKTHDALMVDLIQRKKERRGCVLCELVVYDGIQGWKRGERGQGVLFSHSIGRVGHLELILWERDFGWNYMPAVAQTLALTIGFMCFELEQPRICIT